MANANDHRPRDDDEPDYPQQPGRIPAVRQVEQRTPQPPPEETALIPSVPDYGSSEQKRQEAAALHQKVYEQPPFRDLTWGRKLGRIGAIAGNVAGEIAIPGVMPTIPGTTVNRMMRMRRLEEEIPVAEREEMEARREKAEEPLWAAETERATAGAAKERAETAGLGYATPVPGEEGIRRDIDPVTGEQIGVTRHVYHDLRKREFEVPDTDADGKPVDPNDWILEHGGTLGANVQPSRRAPAVEAAPPAAAPAQAGPPAAPIPSVQAPPPVAAPTPAPARKTTTVVGMPKEKQPTATEAEELEFLQAYADQRAGKQLTAEQQANIARNEGRFGHLVSADANDLKNGNDYLASRYRVAQQVLGREAPRPPALVAGENRAQIQDKMARYDQQLSTDMDRKIRELEAQPYKDAMLQQKQLQLQKTREEMDQEATVGVSNYLAQENYKDAMDRWIKSPHYMKDIGLITDMANHARTELPKSPGLTGLATELGSAAAGSMLGGPAGAIAGLAVGATVNLVQGAIAGPANGYLDALKKSQISQEGYDAAQAYFNALPGRMAYEITTQGLKASTLRSQELLNKVMQTIPPPDTKADAFDREFEMYYRPMKVLTDNKYRNREGFVPPTKEQLYPPRPQGGPAVNAPPPGVKPRSWRELH